MKLPLAAALLLIAAVNTVSSLEARQEAQQEAMFRATAHTVAVYPLVSGADGRIATDLARSDFTVLDNGQPAEITVFSTDTQPVTAVLLLDMSASMEDRTVRVRDAATGFVNAIAAKDRLRIGSFGAEIAISPLLTGDKAVLTRILREELWPGGSTPLWNGLDAAMRSLANEPGRRTIVVVTDGIDTSNVTQDAVARRAVAGLFMVYAIGLEGKGLSAKLTDVIAQTGGGHFNLRRQDDLAAAFTRLATELRHQYLIGFTPAVMDGRLHTLEVRVNQPGMRVQAPRQFQSPVAK